MIRIAPRFILATTIGFSVAACDLTESAHSELEKFQQISHKAFRLAFRVLDQFRLHLKGTYWMSVTPTPTVAQSATTFDQSIGVNVHMAYTSTPYGNVASVISDLAYLGVNQVRDGFFNAPRFLPAYEALAAAGIKFDFLLTVYWASDTNHYPGIVNVPQFISMLDSFVTAYPGSVLAIEGPNEVNFQPAEYNGGSSYADQAALQQALYSAVRANAVLDGIPVYNLTIGSTTTSEFQALGNLSPYANYGNEHAYSPNNQNPAVALQYLLTFPGIDTPGLPVVITETGYETNVAATYSGVDQLVQAKLTLDSLMDAFKVGVSKTYLYELVDEGGQYFGLFTADHAPKLVATAIHNLTTILADPGYASSFTPGSLSYAVSNLSANGNQFLLEKSNGTFDLTVWAEAEIWNPTTASEVAAPRQATTVEFGQTQNIVMVFDPLQGTTPIATYLNVQSIQVTLTDHPLIVEIPSPARRLPPRS